ncbi:hypothetical protein EJ08DRAFT_204270 [Tothia fuscella]|uniref:Uncharacterized protein n=1 Tax=Tothia fuscella TaxID=1048955 RepID=A0A9P4NRT0_9PEZI|nr:hypothetical protein EJ08DRAFT_204270 [Tothia fuscella]
MAAKKTRPSPFKIYSDSSMSFHDQRSSSPSPYDADGSMLSDENDFIIPSIEAGYERRNSVAYTAISSIPPSLRASDISPFTPRKGPRAAFQSPDSIRALQMASPPPFSRLNSGTSNRKYRPEAQSSTRSGSSRRDGDGRIYRRSDNLNPCSTTGSEIGTSTREHQDSPKVRGPLVLLHVTMLPCPSLAYSTQNIAEHGPASFLENWRLLQEKLSDTVLARGILIPHPGEEYDLLEERLLESLDLIPPRILDCGHFYGADDDVDDDSGTDSGVSDMSRNSGSSRAICETSQDADDENVCNDCSRQILRPGMGIGLGDRRFNVKIFAANGLMRAGAWAAAWREMERVDVEIEPWLSEDMKRELDSRREQDEQEEQTVADEADRLRFEVGEMERARMEAEAAKAKSDAKAMEWELEVKKLNATLISISQATTPTAVPETSKVECTPKDNSNKPPNHAARTKAMPQLGKEIPLTTVLWNYIYLLAQDRRNLALAFLSILVVFLALSSGTGPTPAPLESVTSFPNNTRSATLMPPFFNTISSVIGTDIMSASSADSPPLSLPTATSAESSLHQKDVTLPLELALHEDVAQSLIAEPATTASASAGGIVEE